jgi:Methyltransferase domain
MRDEMMVTPIPTAASMKEQRELPAEKMPGHWLLARMGKRVLRPGGLELTRWLLEALALSPTDDVIEFAPGFGVTTRLALGYGPRSYTAVERDPKAAATVAQYLTGARRKCVFGTAEEIDLVDESATVVYGEAMPSMQPTYTKFRIVSETARLLKPDGRYGIHELCLVPDDVEESIRDEIQHDLSDEVHVGVRPLTVREWHCLLWAAGLRVVAEHRAPMHLLEPVRLVRDEGLFGAIRFSWNVATHAAARRRVLRMRRVFRKYEKYLAATALVAKKPAENEL